MLLINPTLVSKVKWAMTAPHKPSRFEPGKTWAQAAKDDLIKFLCRKGFEDTVATAKGKEYESIVNTMSDALGKQPLVDTENLKTLKPIEAQVLQRILNAVAYNQQQVFKTTTIEDNSITTEAIRLYGYLDYLDTHNKAIQDLKTTSAYKSEKYDSNMQDITYRYLLQKETGEPYSFKYLIAVIADGYKYPTGLIVRAHPALPLPALYAVLRSNIIDTLSFIQATGLWNLYRECYCHKGQGFKDDMELHEQKALYSEWQQRMGV